MKVYMLYNPIETRWLCTNPSLWIFRRQENATCFTNPEAVEEAVAECVEAWGVQLEIQTFDMVRV